LESFPQYDGQSTCDPTPDEGVKAFRDYVLHHFGGGDMGIARECDQGGKSEHKEGRAWDWGVVPGASLTVPYTEPKVDKILEWLFQNDAEIARRAGIMYLIYNRRVWRAYKDPHWEDYTGKSPHIDHFHISFSRDGGNGLTSLYTSEILNNPPRISGKTSSAASFLLGAAVGFGVVFYVVNKHAA